MSNDLDNVRLQKLLANAGFASRRKVEELIVQGRIEVNGNISSLGDKANHKDNILVDGLKVNIDIELETYLLNKPLKVVSTTSDEHGRKSVVDLIETDKRIYPVGRLDYETSGLIILTNDGDLTYHLTHPKFEIPKKYVVSVEGEIEEENILLLKNGVILEDGITAPAQVRILAIKTNSTLFELTIHEGRNRQVRRMCDAIGHSVVSLHRSQIGPIRDSNLKIGQYRKLSLDEIHQLYKTFSVNT